MVSHFYGYILCVLMQLLADPWGTYSDEDIAAALPTLQVRAYQSTSLERSHLTPPLPT